MLFFSRETKRAMKQIALVVVEERPPHMILKVLWVYSNTQ